VNTERTSIQPSSFISTDSSLVLEPFTATLLLGGARSSVLLTAGLFLSSILDAVEGPVGAEGVVATGIRKSATISTKSCSREWHRQVEATEGLMEQLSPQAWRARDHEAKWGGRWRGNDGSVAFSQELKFRGSVSQVPRGRVSTSNGLVLKSNPIERPLSELCCG
jgi:hypothetical protein